jgi:hypothetical protein
MLFRRINSDVLVTMTGQEETKLEYVKYGDMDDNYCARNSIIKATDCTICLDDFEKDSNVLITKCKHLFHKDCCDTWLKNYSVKCPICKSKIVAGKAQINNV